jgi:hypothetical protein
MARIRSIKPEFPQSESMGRVSRDARLLFVMLWPICDDHGRARAASRMLASLLFPYDDDAVGLIDGWLDELEREGCIGRYESDGSTFLVVHNWLIHQRIDKPSKPQFPEPPETFARIREGSWLEGKGRERKGKDIADAIASAPVDPEKPKQPEPPAKPAKPKSSAVTIATWLASVGDADAIPADDPIFDYAEKVGIPPDYLTLSWLRFVEDHRAKAKRQKDWPATYRNAVRGNWYGIWFIKPETGECVLTTKGEQARRALA